MTPRPTSCWSVLPFVFSFGCSSEAETPPPGADAGNGSADTGSSACQGGCGRGDGAAPPPPSDGGAPDGSVGPSGDAGSSIDAGADARPLGPAHVVGGRLAGLTPGESITLQNNSGDDLTLSENGTFTFATGVGEGGSYAVTILTSPSSPILQTCMVWDGSGTMGTATVTNVTLNCDLLTYFPFGGNADDASGYGHDGVVSGATLTSDRNGNANRAYAFGGDAGIQAAMPVGFLPVQDEPRTLVAWLMPTQSTSAWDVIFWGEGNCTALQFGLGDQGDNAAFWGGCDDYTSGTALPLGAWSFVAIVYSPATPTSIEVYVNGTSSTGMVTPLNTGGSASFVMGGAGGSFFTGDIDSVRVYGHALQPAEIAALFGATDP